jgi:hypothetical protein
MINTEGISIIDSSAALTPPEGMVEVLSVETGEAVKPEFAHLD